MVAEVERLDPDFFSRVGSPPLAEDEIPESAVAPPGLGDPAALEAFDKSLDGRSSRLVDYSMRAPQVIADARSRQTVVRATKLAEQFYKEDREQAGAFFQAMMANGGNVQAAVTAAGLPRNRPDVSIETIMLGDRRILAIIDKMSGVATPVTTEGGEQVLADPRAGTGAAKVPAQLQVVEWVRTNMTGPNGEALTADQAWQIANAAKQNPTNAIARVWATVFQDTFSREEADRAAAEFGQFLQQFNPAAAMTGGAAPQQPMAQPQQGMSRGTMGGRPQFRFNTETRGIE